jgi:hypothetical protein
MLLALFGSVVASPTDGPLGVETDCTMRRLMLEFADKQVDFASGHVFDALQLATLCNMSLPEHMRATALQPLVKKMSTQPQDEQAVYVDYASGDDGAAGDLGHPFRTIARALALRAEQERTGHFAIVLRDGVHFLASTLDLTVAHSNTLIEAYCPPSGVCEQPWISGGVEVMAAASGSGSWQPYNINASDHSNIWQLDVAPAVVQVRDTPTTL